MRCSQRPGTRRAVAATTGGVALMRTFWQVLGASIVAGFGLAFGRDIYKEVKRNWGVIVVILLALSLLIGLFYSAILVIRNYDTRFWSIAGRVGGVILFIVCYGTLLGILNATDPSSLPKHFNDLSLINRIYVEFWRFDGRLLCSGSTHNVLFILQNIILLAGLIVGVRGRYQEAV